MGVEEGGKKCQVLDASASIWTKNKIINFNKVMIYVYTAKAGVHAIDRQLKKENKQTTTTFRVRINRTWNAIGHNC